MFAEGSITSFAAGSFNDVYAGFDQVAAFLDVFKNAEEDCKMMGENWNWDRIDKIVTAWNDPLGFSYHQGKDIIFNGRDIIDEIVGAIEMY